MQEYIEIRRARENNLKDVSVRIPKRKITIFTGVSGSGKSSIVFDTIATEAQRQLYENFSLFVRHLPPKTPPHVGRRAGELVARLRPHRDRGPATALRELQPVRPQLPAEVPATGRRRDREP